MKKWLLFLSLCSGLVFNAWSGSDGSLIIILDNKDESSSDESFRPLTRDFLYSLGQDKASILVSERLVKSLFFKLKVFDALDQKYDGLKEKASQLSKKPMKTSLIPLLEQTKAGLETKINIEKKIIEAIEKQKKIEVGDIVLNKQMIQEYSKYNETEEIKKLTKENEGLDKSIANLDKEIAELSLKIEKEEKNKLIYETEITEIKEAQNMGLSYRDIDKFYTHKFNFDSWSIFKIKDQKSFVFVPRAQKDIVTTLESKIHSATDEHFYQKFDSLDSLYTYLNSEIKYERYNPFEQIRDFLSALKDLNKEWSVLSIGHGAPFDKSDEMLTSTVAGVSAYTFSQILTLLATKVKTKIFYYSTCYGGGQVADFVSGHMQTTKKSISKFTRFKNFLKKESVLFPVVTETFLDATCTGVLESNKLLKFFGFLAPLKLKKLTYDSIAQAVLQLHPIVGACPSFYDENSLGVFPAVFMPQEKNFKPLILCNALKVLTEEHEGPVETDLDTRLLLCNSNHIPYEIIFTQSVPKILSYGSGNTQLNFADIKVEPSLHVSFSDFILKSFFHTKLHYDHTYTVDNLTAWVSPEDINYEILKPFLNQDGVISLSHVFIKYNTVDERTFNINSSISFKVSKDGDVTEFESINKNRPERDFSKPFTLQIK